MKKYLVLALAVVLVFGLGSVALAQVTDSTNVTVNVVETVALSVPDNVSLTIPAVTEAGQDYNLEAATCTVTTPAGFKFSHNHNGQMKVTAVAGTVTPETSDLDVQVTVGTGTAVEVVTDGAATTGGVVYTADAGPSNEDIKFQITGATMAGCPHGNYSFEVTFTATDVT